MYTYRVSSDVDQKVRDLTESQNLDTLKTKIDNLNKSFETYVGSVPTAKSFDYLQVESPSDDELMTRAKNSLYEYKAESVDKINKEASEKHAKLVQDIDTVVKSADAQKSDLADKYEQARENVSNDALKRGLARSSIVINNLDALTKAELDTYNAIDSEMTNKINAINFEISAINAQKENALNDFDIKYAVKLDQKLTELKDQLTAQQLEVAKYNNEIAKLENDYNLKYANLQQTLDQESWDKEYDLAKLAGQYGTNMLDKYKANRVYSLVKDYLSNFSHDEAIRILANSDYLKSVLGSKYSAMVDELNVGKNI